MMKVLLAAVIAASMSSAANAAFIQVRCRSVSWTNENDRMINVTTVKIDVDRKSIHFDAGGGLDWYYNNDGRDGKTPFVDYMSIHQFENGVISAGGVRFNSAFMIEYHPSMSSLMISQVDGERVNTITYLCR